MTCPGSEDQLEALLASPSASDVEALRSLSGDVMILGAGGKMGPSLARRVRRASEIAGARRRVIAVSRFSSQIVKQRLEDAGVETMVCDLLDPRQIQALPACENILYLAGRKFGSSERPDLTWAINTTASADVVRRFCDSRIVAFSTGNVYPFVPVSSGGSREDDPPTAAGEYAQACLGRERVFEYYSRENGTRCLLFRLNYAVDLRYGVLVDVARKVHDGQAIDLTVGSFNAIWQGDANSYALRSFALCESPPRILNVTGPEIISVRHAAWFFAQRFGTQPVFLGEEGPAALLSNAALCHGLLGCPEVSAQVLMDWVATWVEAGGATLNLPTKYEVTDGGY